MSKSYWWHGIVSLTFLTRNFTATTALAKSSTAIQASLEPAGSETLPTTLVHTDHILLGLLLVIVKCDHIGI